MFEQIQSQHDDWRKKVLIWLSDIDAFKLSMLVGGVMSLIGLILMVPGLARMLGWVLTFMGGGLLAIGILLNVDPPSKG
jgi:hypothetical protein